MSRHRGRAHGRILEVTEETLGSVLAADAAAGATVLYVDDAADFEDDGTGGTLSINDQVVAYTDVDDDAGTITLATGLTVAADQGDRVDVWSRLYDTAVTLKTALVQVDGEDDNTDPIVATLADAVQDLPEGLRGEAGENCTLQQVSADEWEVTAVGGRPSSTKGASAVRFATDSFTVTAAGPQAFTLSHEPTADAKHEHVRWHPDGGAGLDWDNTEWSRSGTALTIPDPDGIIEPGDKFTLKYGYLIGVASPWTVLVDWQAAGWKYLLTTVSADVDRSAVGYDDSGWAIGPAAFGNAPNHPSTYPADQKSGWPDKSTTWPVTMQGSTDNSRIWLRRAVDCTPNKLVRVSARIDNEVTFWWNGVQVGSGQSTEFTPVQFDIDPGNVQASNVLAVRGEDYGADDYLDVQVLTQGGAV